MSFSRKTRQNFRFPSKKKNMFNQTLFDLAKQNEVEKQVEDMAFLIGHLFSKQLNFQICFADKNIENFPTGTKP